MGTKKEHFALTNVVLYAKGWYKHSGDVFEDLKAILELDGFSPFDKIDVYSIILSAVQKSNIYRWTELREVLNGIHPSNCWKTGYYCKENHQWSNRPIENLPDYDMVTAFVYYTLSNLRFIDRDKWTVAMPKVTKFPRANHITINDLYKHFCQK